MKRFDKDAFLRYCEENIGNYKKRMDLALDTIGDYRCPLSFADSGLYDDMDDALRDYCEENGYNYGKYDIDNWF